MEELLHGLDSNTAAELPVLGINVFCLQKAIVYIMFVTYTLVSNNHQEFLKLISKT